MRVFFYFSFSITEASTFFRAPNLDCSCSWRLGTFAGGGRRATLARGLFAGACATGALGRLVLGRMGGALGGPLGLGACGTFPIVLIGCILYIFGRFSPN